MFSICETTINEIRSVVTDKEVTEVIGNSLSQFATMSPHDEGSYIISMIVSLQAAKGKRLSTETLRRIEVAVEFFRKYKKQHRERLFEVGRDLKEHRFDVFLASGEPSK